MSVFGILFYVSLPIGLWIAAAFLWTIGSPYPITTDTAMVAGGFAIITCPFWIILVIYLAKTLVPRLDSLAEPELTDSRRYSTNWMTKFMALNVYSANLVSSRARRKYNLPIDLREQPGAVRLALRVHVYWMFGINLTLLIGFLLMPT
ncbi:hypothetical protein [Marinobacter sp. LN3S78]|uniref:hypothetical protein n=1 Tax=Marinobacter sp. LN3S78 TaxID=3382300 RepID=UPI00387AA168